MIGHTRLAVLCFSTFVAASCSGTEQKQDASNAKSSLEVSAEASGTKTADTRISSEATSSAKAEDTQSGALNQSFENCYGSWTSSGLDALDNAPKTLVINKDNTFKATFEDFPNEIGEWMVKGSLDYAISMEMFEPKTEYLLSDCNRKSSKLVVYNEDGDELTWNLDRK